LGYLGCFENNSFISHISPKKVPTSEKLTEHNVQNEDSLNLVVKIENPSSNLFEICSYISSFFTLPHGPDKDLFLVGFDMAEMIFDYL
jgi:hypothetical protein